MSVFDKAQQAQLNIAQIYSLLAQRFPDTPRLKALFTLLAEEKKSQTRRIDDVARCWANGGDGWSLALEEAEMAHLLDKSEAALARVVHATEISPQRALEIARKVEDDLHDARAEALAKETCPKMRAALEELVEHDHGHRNLLIEASKES